MSRRAFALAVSAILLAGTFAPAPTLAADPWTISSSSGRVAASFTSATSGTNVALALVNRTSIADAAGLGEGAGLILDALGLGGTYSQSATWATGSGPQVRCPPVGVNLACWTNAGGAGTVLIPGSVRAALLASAPAGTGRTDLAVAPGMISLTYDVTLIAIGIALSTAGIRAARADMVTALALELYPEAAGAGAALARGDARTAGSELLSLSKRAWSVIRQKAIGASVGLLVNLIPGVLQVKLGIAVAKAILPLANLAVAVLQGASSTVTLGYGGGGTADGGGATAAKPGGTWIEPASAATETGAFRVSVHAYPTNSGDPPIDHVNVAVWWPALGPRSGPWKVACTVPPPPSGDVYTCDIDPAKLGALPGELAVSFDVYDRASGRNLAPNGERGLTWIPVPSASWRWRSNPVDLYAWGEVTLLPDGRVLIFADPRSGDWIQLVDPCIDDVTGGFLETFGGLSGTLVDLGGTKTETAISPMVNTSFDTALLPDGRMLVVGVAMKEDPNTGATELHPAADVFDPSANRWSVVGEPATFGNASILVLDANHVALLGGSDRDGNAVDLVQVLTVSNGDVRTVGHLQAPTWSPLVALLPDGRVFLDTGDIVDLPTGEVGRVPPPRADVDWQAIWPLPDGALALTGTTRDAASATLVTSRITTDPLAWSDLNQVRLEWNPVGLGRDSAGRVILAGGWQRGTCTPTYQPNRYTTRVIAIDPTDGSVTEIPALQEAVVAGAVLTLADGRLAMLPVGGAGDSPAGDAPPHVEILGP